MKIPCDPKVAAQLQSNIDPCAFGRVKQYFRNTSTEISQVVLVQQDYLLQDVAAFLCGKESKKEDFASMLQNGAIKFVVDNMSGVHPDFRDNAVLLDSIQDEQRCYVLYLPPYYVVKLAD